jgi:two-component SAPR family response regulator
MSEHLRNNSASGQKPLPLRIHTLGRFEILSAGSSPRQSKKAQQKPLQMLKALIAMGGKNASKGSLIDILWPDSEGDTANQSFATTLHRLRKLLGNRNAIKLRESLVSLDPEVCWLDTWAFESLVDEANGKPGGNPHLLEQAVSLYRGHFLPADDGEPWTASTRERLRSKFLRSVEKLCHYYESQGDIERAVECYHSALEVDDLSERLYRNLMSCHGKLGQKADAVSVYNRCCRVFEASLGVGPSDETEAVYRSIVSE